MDCMLWFKKENGTFIFSCGSQICHSLQYHDNFSASFFLEVSNNRAFADIICKAGGKVLKLDPFVSMPAQFFKQAFEQGLILSKLLSGSEPYRIMFCIPEMAQLKCDNKNITKKAHWQSTNWNRWSQGGKKHCIKQKAQAKARTREHREHTYEISQVE